MTTPLALYTAIIGKGYQLRNAVKRTEHIALDCDVVSGISLAAMLGASAKIGINCDDRRRRPRCVNGNTIVSKIQDEYD